MPTPLRAALLGLLGLSLLALGACAPRAQTPGTASATTSVNAVSFYPAQGGLSWSYIPEGDQLNQPPYLLSALGATVFGNQPASAFRLSGRGADQTWYRQVNDAGILLFGFTKPGLTVNLTPPWREAPAKTDWKVGLTWEGQSKVQVIQDGKVVQEGTASYRYTVTDQRRVSVSGQGYLVWVVNRQINDDLGGLFPPSQDSWFTPFVGDVRTTEGLLLVGKNYKGE